MMDEVIALGIRAKDATEDQMAPFDVGIQRYGKRISPLSGNSISDDVAAEGGLAMRRAAQNIRAAESRWAAV